MRYEMHIPGNEMTDIQKIVVMAFGALIALAGLWLLFTRQEAGANRLKILGQEFEISTPALVVFLVGSAIFVLPFFLPRQDATNVVIGEPPKKPPQGTFTEEKEPNDSFASATPVKLGSHVKGRIGVEDDRDFFVFRTSSNHQSLLTIHLENPSMTLSPELVVYNDLKAEVKRIYETTRGADLKLSSFPARPDSTFFVEVRSIRAFRTIGEYQLKIATND
jgi:hypothetical protein